MGNDTSTDDIKTKPNNNKHKNNTCKFIKFECSTTFSDEMRKKCVPMPQSLYCEHINDSDSEKVLSADGVDRRIRAPINIFNNKTNAIYNIGLLRMQFGKKMYSGTGTIIHRVLDCMYILTAAHNVISIKKKLNHEMMAKNVEFNIIRNVENGYKEIASYPAISCDIHPKYELDASSESGYDIAIIKIKFDINNDMILKNIKPVSIRKFESKSEYDGAKVIGFPGDADKISQLYGMCGDYNLENNDKLIIYKEIDTSPGQSGSPIFCQNENKENDNDDDIFDRFEEIVGVHTGGSVAFGKNWGTALNDEKLKWIADVLQYESVAQPVYAVNALLISSNPQYDADLDKMYKTFNNSQVINSKKIYFNNNHGVISKSHILDEIKKIFCERNSDSGSYKRTMICFCGESDRKGNWIINKKNKNDIQSISLNHIIDTKKMTDNGEGIVIITDCSYSENWIITADQYPSHYVDKRRIFIQASAGKDEVAEPGVFMSKYSYSCLRWWAERSTIREVVTLPTAAVGVIVAAPKLLLWDVGVKNVYNIATATFTPVSSNKYYHKEGKYWTIAKTNDQCYRLDLLLTNSWSLLDSNETMCGVVKYAGFGLGGNC